MRFLVDENLSALHAANLRAMGHDAVAVVELSLSGAPDDEVRAVAIRDGRILVTLDGDFANVLRYPPGETPGVIRLRVHPPSEAAIAAALRRAVACLHAVELTGKLVVVDELRIRIRS